MTVHGDANLWVYFDANVSSVHWTFMHTGPNADGRFSSNFWVHESEVVSLRLYKSFHTGLPAGWYYYYQPRALGQL